MSRLNKQENMQLKLLKLLKFNSTDVQGKINSGSWENGKMCVHEMSE